MRSKRRKKRLAKKFSLFPESKRERKQSENELEDYFSGKIKKRKHLGGYVSQKDLKRYRRK